MTDYYLDRSQLYKVLIMTSVLDMKKRKIKNTTLHTGHDVFTTSHHKLSNLTARHNQSLV